MTPTAELTAKKWNDSTKIGTLGSYGYSSDFCCWLFDHTSYQLTVYVICESKLAERPVL
jgi:hypothetical protein